MTRERELAAFAEAVERWATSKRGKRAVETAQQTLNETKRELAQERVIDPRLFRMPITA